MLSPPGVFLRRAPAPAPAVFRARPGLVLGVTGRQNVLLVSHSSLTRPRAVIRRSTQVCSSTAAALWSITFRA